MNKGYLLFTLAVSFFLLVSYSANPPDGKTGAPGDSLCIECHTPNNSPLRGTISVEGFPASITPNETYLLTVINRDTIGTAVKGGFQLTILGPFNTKAGSMEMPSSSSIVSNEGGRQYFEHNPAVEYPDSNVIKWMVEWTAPDMVAGSTVTWYAAGNITNGDFTNGGDRVVTANGQGTIVLSGTADLKPQKPAIYPNPGADQIHILFTDGAMPDGTVFFYHLDGSMVHTAYMIQGTVNTPELVSGVYILKINEGNRTHAVKWTKI